MKNSMILLLTLASAAFSQITPPGGGGGSGTFVTLSGDASSTSTGGATVVNGLKGVPFCTGYTPTNGQFVEYTTGGSPNPCYSAATAGAGGSLPVVAFNPNTATSLTCPGTSGAQFVASTTLTGAASIPTVSCAPTGGTAVTVQIVLVQGSTPYALTLPSPWNFCDFTRALANDTMTESATYDGTNVVDTSCSLTSGAGDVVSAVSPGVGIAHFAGSTQTVTSSAVNLAGGSNEVTGLLPTGNIATAQVTRTISITDLAPVVGDSGLILIINPTTAIHLTRVFCAIQGSTNVVMNLDKRTEGAIGTDSGYHLIGDLTAVAGGANTATFVNTYSQCGGTTSCAVGTHIPVVMTFTSVSATPTALNCSIDYTVD